MGISIKEMDRYKVHSFNGRKYWKMVQDCILNNTKENDVIFDPFIGSGTTAIESLILKRKVIGIDINPLSLFLINSTLDNINISDINKEFENIQQIKSDIFELYKSKTICSKCGINYIIYSYVFNKQTSYYCECCKKIIKLNKNPDFLIKTPIIKKWVPKDKMDFNLDTNVKYVVNLFSSRNLVALSIILDKINKIKNIKLNQFFKFCFSANLSKSTKLNTLKNNGGWGKKYTNSFVVSVDYIDFNVWFGFVNKVISGINLKKEIYKFKLNNKNCILHLSNSEKINLDDDSIDFILTDPPYYTDISYKAASKINLSWLNLSECNGNSLEEFKNKSDFSKHLSDVIRECFRVLKKGKKLVYILANVDVEYVNKIILLTKKVGFLFIDKCQSKTYEKLDYVYIIFKKE